MVPKQQQHWSRELIFITKATTLLLSSTKQCFGNPSSSRRLNLIPQRSHVAFANRGDHRHRPHPNSGSTNHTILIQSHIPKPFRRYSHESSSTTATATNTTTTSDSSVEHIHKMKSYHLTGHGTSQSTTTSIVQTDDTNHQHQHHILRTDLPLHMGGQNTAAQPVELLLAAYIGCTQATAVYVGRNMRPTRVMIERMEFDIQGERDDWGALGVVPIHVPSSSDSGHGHGHAEESSSSSSSSSSSHQNDDEDLPSTPARLQLIKGVIKVFAKDRKGQAVEIGQNAMKALEKQTEHRCPVANMMIASGCMMDIEWVDGNGLSKESH